MKNRVCLSVLGVENKTELINKAIIKGIDWIHYDIMDGHFVKNISLAEEELDFILKNSKNHIKDLHLMVLDPLKWIIKYHKQVDYITFHYEAESIDRIKKIIKDFSGKVNIGIAINPKTNVEQIYEFIPDISHILVMSVVPGLGGQKFIAESLEKIRIIKSKFDKINSKGFIQVDGGINDQTGPQTILSGASALVSGSYIIKNLDNPRIIEKILKNS